MYGQFMVVIRGLGKLYVSFLQKLRDTKGMCMAVGPSKCGLQNKMEFVESET